jgi:UDP-N-acetyl-D-galactosamine dehydrogenase
MSNKIAIIGLGYVGIPLAVEFGKLFPTIVLDIKGIVNEPIWRL